MDEKKKKVIRQNVQGMFDTVDWDAGAKSAMVMAIDWVQGWILPALKKANATLGSFAEVGLQAAEDYLKDKA